ncbi:MAG: flagellar export chaperone FlgN [Nitriliruptor sp.]|uniref:flagellar protein FlgN n=1 Tax=Nitriliruptor sp. TaxID=2448056 RepID=UPI0034A003B7
MDDTRDVGHLEELAETLWQERHLTELLLYKLVCTRMLLAADEQRYTGICLNEVDSVLSRLRDAETHRDDVVQALAVTWGVSIDQLYLSTLADRSPEPWAAIFDDHRKAFLSLTSEIESVAVDNRRLASSGLHRVQQTMAALTGGSEHRLTYDPDGRRSSSAGPALVDQAL